ncbi:hypothetical protein CSKR_109220, partial [Clonorchis sinensis]
MILSPGHLQVSRATVNKAGVFDVVRSIFEISRYMYIRNGLLIRLLKILRQPTTGFALLGAHQCLVPENKTHRREHNSFIPNKRVREHECENTTAASSYFIGGKLSELCPTRADSRCLGLILEGGGLGDSECEFTHRNVRGSNLTSASRLPLCLGLGNLAASQPSCFLLVAWQLGTETAVQLNDDVINRSNLTFCRRNTLLIRLLKSFRQPTTGFETLLGLIRITPICKSIWFCERLIWNPAKSLVCDVSRQLNVLHQAASCSSCYDDRDIAMRSQTNKLFQKIRSRQLLDKYTHLQINLVFARDSSGTQLNLPF